MSALAKLSAPHEGLARSARLMRALGPDASAIWQELAPDEVRTLSDAISQLGPEGQCEAEAVDRFVDAHRRLGAAHSGANLWPRLSAMNDDALASLFANEHPQLKALVLSRLSGDAAARLLRALPASAAVDAMQRLLHLADVHPIALRVLEAAVEKRLEDSVGSGARNGHERVARIFDRFDTRAGEALFAAFESAEPGAGEKIRALMFTFDDLASLNAGGLQTLLASADRETLVIALKGASETVLSAFFANMTKRAGDLLREEIASQGAVRRSDVEVARQELIELARALIHRGDIRDGSDLSEDELVE
jgi:flagellar motor switch protein FliG